MVPGDVSMKWRAVWSWAFAAWAISACTLDFDQFTDVESEPDVNFVDVTVPPVVVPDARPLPDVIIPDVGVDAAPVDTDSDGLIDAIDNCPEVPNPDQADLDADEIGDLCDPDRDGDEVDDGSDNCPLLANPVQFDLDGDGEGDACDDDIDGDGLTNALEESRGTDPGRGDSDGDGFLDGADNCPTVPDRPGLDRDGDGAGDACDQDDDADGVADWDDNCPGTPNADQGDADEDGWGDACADDADGDGVSNGVDTCPYEANPVQNLQPCYSRFYPVPFNREVRAVVLGEAAVYAGSSSGVIEVVDGNVQLLTNGDGLDGNRIYGLSLDERGRRWAATDRGLVVMRPDGFVFAAHAGDAGGGPRGVLRDVVVDASGDVWASSDQGLNRWTSGAWSLLAIGALPSVDARGLWLDSVGRLWVATGGGVVRFTGGVPDATFTGVGDTGNVFNDIAGDADGSVWLLAENGAVHIDTDDLVIDAVRYDGFAARGLANGPDGARYIAADDGIRRIDEYGRLYPPGAALLPSADARAVASQPDGPRWIGTADGLVALDGYFATWSPGDDTFESPCVNAAYRADDVIWIGTSTGLYRVGADGVFAPVEEASYPGSDVRVIRRIGDEVWVGTEGGIGVFLIDGTPDRTYTFEGDGLPEPPIVDIVGGRGAAVWVASAAAGLGRISPDGIATYTTGTAGPNFASNDLRALAHTGNSLWIGSRGGVMQYVEDAPGEQPFAPPVTDPPNLPSPEIYDLTYAEGRLYVATRLGVAVREEGAWTTLRRANDGWPITTGTDDARAVAHDGTYLWIVLNRSGTQPSGSLVRHRAVAGAGGLVDGDVRIFSADTAGLPAVAGGRADAFGREVYFSHCGAADSPGGLSVLDGGGVVRADYREALGLPGRGEARALSRDPEGRPLYTVLVDGKPYGYTVDGEREVSSFFLPPNVTGLPKRCRTPIGGGQMWCVIEGVGVGRRIDDLSPWSVIPRDAFSGADVRDIAVLADQVIWLATNRGVFFVNAGNVRSFNAAGTMQGLPDDDVRVITLGSDGRVYAGTAGGVGIFDPNSGPAGTWETVPVGPGGLESGEVTSLGIDASGNLWIGTTNGLYRRTALGGALTYYDTADGLPTNHIYSVAAHPDLTLYVGTPHGLAIGTVNGEAAQFETLGFVDGMPGWAAWDLAISPDGALWLRSDDGLGMLRPPAPPPDVVPPDDPDAGVDAPDAQLDVPDMGLADSDAEPDAGPSPPDAGI